MNRKVVLTISVQQTSKMPWQWIARKSSSENASHRHDAYMSKLSIQSSLRCLRERVGVGESSLDVHLVQVEEASSCCIYPCETYRVDLTCEVEI